MSKSKKYKCVYCNKPIKYEGSCDRCGHKEDVSLGKVDGDVLDGHQRGKR